jgi:hypothetical protein
MTAAHIDLSWYAPRQPFPDLPSPGFDRFYGVDTIDIGDDGAMLIPGHVGTLRAVAVFRARLRWLLGSPREANEVMRSLDYARGNIAHLWAVQVPRCDAYPMCGSLGPIEDGKPCRDDRGRAYDDHEWSSWYGRPEILGPAREGGVERLRCCRNCALYETDPPSVVVNPCAQCREIDDYGWLIRWDATPDTPGAFPITLWRA